MNTGAEVDLLDDRKAARGWGRLIPVMFWVGAIALFAAGFWQLGHRDGAPIGASLVTIFAALLYLASAIGLTHNGRRMRTLAWATVSMAFAAPVVVGLIELGGPTATNWSPWSRFGAQVWFLSLLVPITGLVWLWRSDPRRIVELAEGLPKR